MIKKKIPGNCNRILRKSKLANSQGKFAAVTLSKNGVPGLHSGLSGNNVLSQRRIFRSNLKV